MYFFRPRIGTYYNEGWEGYRTLVLGAHHICRFECEYKSQCCSADGVVGMDNACPCYADVRDNEYLRLSNGNVVEMNAYIEDAANFPSYSAFTKFMLGRRNFLSQDERARFWDHVVFYNFLQHYMPSANTPSYKGNEAMYDAALPALKEMIESLPEPPQVILVWSDAVADCLDANMDFFPGLRKEYMDKESQVMEVRRYSLNATLRMSRQWVKDYIGARLESCKYVNPQEMKALDEAIYLALKDGFLEVSDFGIVVPYKGSRRNTKMYGAFFGFLHSIYKMQWNDISKLITKIGKDGLPQKQNLRSVECCIKGEDGFVEATSFFRL